MKCNHCGAEIQDDSVFCEHCGKKIGEDTPNATNNEKKKLAMWIGIAVAAVVAVLLLVLLIGKGGNSAEIPLVIAEEEPLPPPPPEPEEPESWENSERIEVPTVADDEVEEVSVSDDKVFSIVETDPEFPGGMEALYQYLASNLHYPQLARDNGITGKVYVTFVVEKDGRVTNPRILRDIGGGCGDEAIRVVKSMPRWSPGKQRGKPVRVQFNLPVGFDLK